MANSNSETPNDIVEGFGSLNKDLALKSILYSLVFYIMASPELARFIPDYQNLDKVMIQSLLFCLVYYVIGSAL